MSTRPAHRAPGSPVRSRTTRLVAASVAVGLTTGLIVISGGPADAATTYSTGAAGRFLSGTIAGLNLDSVAGIEGETAKNNFGPTVTNKNSLNAEVLNGAIKIPLANGLQLPGLNVLQLGAVSQYAQATPTGAALGASGAVDSNGGIGAGGSNGAPTGGATLDLSGLGGQALAQLLNVKADIGAISARAIQAPADGSQTVKNGCPGESNSTTLKNGDQLGQYCIAGLDLELDIPAIAGVLTTVLTPVQNLLNMLSTTLDVDPSILSVPPLGDAVASLEQVSLPASGPGAGAISLDLKTGTVKVSVEKLLQSLGLDLNNLPPNTSLVPYIVKALAGLPAALSTIADSLVGKINDVVGGITLLGQKLSTVLLTVVTTALDPLLKTLTSTLTSVIGQITPITNLLSSLLDIVVNGQSTSGGIFTETSVQLKLGGALSGLNGTVASILNTLTGLLGTPITPAAKSQISTADTKIRTAANQSKQIQAARASSKSTKAPATKSTSSVKVTKLATFDSAVLPRLAARTRPFAAAPADPLIQLNLAQASVGPSTPRTTTPTTSAPPSTSVPTTSVPTGVPAGQAGGNGGSPELPLVLVLITLVLAGGGVTTYRLRWRRAQQH